jgi:hypothetical protein
MTTLSWKSALIILIAVGLTGCSQAPAPAGAEHAPAASRAAASEYLLSTEPPGARGVIEIRKQANDGDEVLVVGRIGGSEKPFVQGRAAFTLVDPSMVACSERSGDSCPTPWDFCCETKEDLARATVMVKVQDAGGKTVAQDADELLGVKPLQTLIVRGRAKRDADGNLTLLASGVFIRP